MVCGGGQHLRERSALVAERPAEFLHHAIALLGHQGEPLALRERSGIRGSAAILRRRALVERRWAVGQAVRVEGLLGGGAGLAVSVANVPDKSERRIKEVSVEVRRP